MHGYSFRVRLKRRALKALEELPSHYLSKVVEVLDELEENPLPYKRFDLRKLRGYDDTYRIRIGGIRIVYSVDWVSKTIVVHFIGYRGSAYK